MLPEGAPEPELEDHADEAEEAKDVESSSPARWLEVGVLIAGSALAVVGVVGLVLAIAGVYRTWVVLAISAPLVAGAAVLALRAVPRGRASRGTHLAAAAAVVIALAYVGFAGFSPSQNVIVARDPGSYLNTAKWISDTGTLRVDPSEGAFDGIDDLQFTSAAVYLEDDGRLEFQFNHLASVVMAVADDVGGPRLLLRTPALASALGLLALYAVAARAIRRPVIALVAPALIGVCLPLLNVSRNTYSEPFALVLLWCAILAMCRLHRRPSVPAGVLGGLLLGAGLCARVDSLVYVAMVFPLAALSMATTSDDDRRRSQARAWLAMLLCLVLVGAIGIVDLELRTGLYFAHLGPQVSLLRKAFLGSLVVSVVAYLLWVNLAWLRRNLPSLLHRIAPVAAVLVAVVFLALWFVRPEVQTARGSYNYSIAEHIQRATGAEVDGTRTYAEDSMRWMSWYLGAPALLAMIVGTALTVGRTLRGTVRPAALAVATLVLGAGAMYLWNPSITPDQLWASRRYVPAILPAMAVMALVTVAWIDAALAGLLERGRDGSADAGPSRADRLIRVGALSVVAAVLVVPAAVTTWPMRNARAQAGHLQMVQEVCDDVGDDGAIIVLGGAANVTLAQTLRSWCGVPVAGQGGAVDAETVEDVARRITDNGYEPFLVAAKADHLDTFVAVTGAVPFTTHEVDDLWTSEPTLEGPPTEYRDPVDANPIDGPFQLHVLPLAGVG